MSRGGREQKGKIPGERANWKGVERKNREEKRRRGTVK